MNVHSRLATLDAVENIVEAAGQGVDVLALERCDEGVAELSEELVGDIVAPVLDLLDPVVLLLDVREVIDQLLEGLGPLAEVGRVLPEEVEELVVLGEQADFHGVFPDT